MPLTEAGTLSVLARTLLPAGQPVQCLILRSCTLSPAAWQPASEQLLSAVTCLSFVDCRPASGRQLAALLDELLGSLPSLSAVTLANCDFTGGLPSVLHQLSGLRSLTLSGARLTSLPALPCVTGAGLAVAWARTGRTPGMADAQPARKAMACGMWHATAM